MIITDKETLEIGSALKKAAETRAKTTEFYILEDFVKEQNAVNCPEAILDAVKKSDVSIYCASVKWHRWNSTSIANDILKVVLKKEGARHARMPGITKEIMENGKFLV